MQGFFAFFEAYGTAIIAMAATFTVILAPYAWFRAGLNHAYKRFDQRFTEARREMDTRMTAQDQKIDAGFSSLGKLLHDIDKRLAVYDALRNAPAADPPAPLPLDAE